MQPRWSCHARRIELTPRQKDSNERLEAPGVGTLSVTSSVKKGNLNHQLGSESWILADAAGLNLGADHG
jgi:hypothetical protein